MQIDILTIFPNQIEAFCSEGLFRLAKEQDVSINAHDLRKWAKGKHKKVDDRPFGGGAGMVMMVEPIFCALKDLRSDDSYVILTSPRGKLLTPSYSRKLAKKEHLIIICGHYEGVDERVKNYLVDEEVSIGKYVLSGGELPALVIADSLLRFVPGVLGNPESLKEESFEGEIEAEYPQYTRPADFNGWLVPDILLSGNHSNVAQWRKRLSNGKE